MQTNKPEMTKMYIIKQLFYIFCKIDEGTKQFSFSDKKLVRFLLDFRVIPR